MDRQQRTEIEGFHADRISPIEKEIMRYESFSLPDKHVDILQWWQTHEKVLPNLSKLAKKVLTVPASSSKSERVFSCGGNFATAKRGNLDPKKIESIIVTKLNKAQVEDFKKKGSYVIEEAIEKPFDKISVDQVISDLYLNQVEDNLTLNSDVSEDNTEDSEEESWDDEVIVEDISDDNDNDNDISDDDIFL